MTATPGLILFFVLTALGAGVGVTAGAKAEEARHFRLSVPPEVAESGVMAYLLPRFALKTGRRAELAGGAADAVLSAEAAGGVPVMVRDGTVYVLRLTGANDAARRFSDWLRSDVGQRTVAAYRPPQGAPFGRAPKVEATAARVIEGNVALGRAVAERHCARCHRTHDRDSSSGIGSTPSFPALRALPDWSVRFEAFFVRNPHPAFLRVEGISPPFDPASPPAILPVALTPDEAEALLAYAASVAPADLGAQIEHQ
ncbi:c-type cytochrome [Antarcticimicrobium luteum]|uniref:C-type cytochrome n=1 Tax=Antarcticimicrobium luteum TaxID=2547397 RepID=A0A4R5VDH2_9RHOB|nr:c-type cytochrome [Antarcticimicrobium luteum]TDK50172.1 c-type cytochrome [Antarcticimicrobium luteum]